MSITLDTYSHAIPAMQETAAALVADLVLGEETPRRVARGLRAGLSVASRDDADCRDGASDAESCAVGSSNAARRQLG